MGDYQKVLWVGIEKLAQVLTAGGEQTVPALAQALSEEAQLAFAASQQIVPRRTGVLAGSGQVMPAEIEENSVSVSLGYGGAASDYALIVHEDPNAKHESGKSFKYLENPVLARVPLMAANISRRIQRILSQ